MFNAVIVLVSHIVDPPYSNDKAALAKVELALHMIQTMSSNHAFAERAYSFLHKLLSYMHQSIAPRQDRDEEALLGDILTTQPAGELPADAPDDPNAVPNLHTFFGLTDDLANSLGLYLNRFDGKDPAEGPWSFNDQWFT